MLIGVLPALPCSGPMKVRAVDMKKGPREKIKRRESSGEPLEETVEDNTVPLYSCE